MRELNEPEMMLINGGGDDISPPPIIPNNETAIALILAALQPAPVNPYDAGNGVYRAV